MSAARKWLHAAGMQAAWFAAALTAPTPWHPLGALANGAVLGLHVATAGHARRELVRAAAALGLGLAVELVQQHVGGLRVQQASLVPPLWLLSLWPVFASAMMNGHALAWLRPRKALAALLGAVVGPVSYAGGGRLGALEFDGVRTGLTIGACWAVALPLLAALADRLERPADLAHRG